MFFAFFFAGLWSRFGGGGGEEALPIHSAALREGPARLSPADRHSRQPGPEAAPDRQGAVQAVCRLPTAGEQAPYVRL